jgi:hypothetical protein
MTDQYQRLVPVEISPVVMKALIASGRLRWSQQNDKLAVGKAVDRLMHDIAAGTEPASEDARAWARKIFWNPP